MKTLWLLCLLLLVAPIQAQTGRDTIHVGGLDGISPWQDQESYPVLLALSGGGARGLASIGVLKAFEEKGITVAAVTGTSMGGIVGGLYACGHSPDQLIAIIRSIDFPTLFTNKPARLSMFLTQRQERDRHILSVRFDGFTPHIPQGLTAGQRLTEILTSLTAKANYHAAGDFTKLDIPFKTITTDIVSGRMEVMSQGSLADAMRATMAFPLAFTGLDRENQILMDGGMVAPIPVSLVRQLCDTVGFVVAINTTSPLLSKEKLTTPVDIANQVTTIMTADQLGRELEQADYVITPLPQTVTSADFNNRDSIIEYGYRAGLTAADSIIPLVRSRRDSSVFHFSVVQIDPTLGSSEDSLTAWFKGAALTHSEVVEQLKHAVRHLGLFELDATIEPVLFARDSVPAPYTEYRLTLLPKTNFISSRTRIQIDGNSLYSDSLLVASMQLPDDTITLADLNSGLDRIVNQYHVDGWDLADICDVDLLFDSSFVRIELDEGIVRRIDVENNTVTRDWLVRSYTPLQVGKPYSTRDATAGLTNIYATDLFDRVSIVPEATDDGAIARISVDEKQYLQARLGWHWDDEYQSEEFLEVLDDNVLGMGIEFLTHLQYGQHHQHYSAELKVNRIFRSYLTSRLQLYHDRLDRSVYNLEQNDIGTREENTTAGIFRIGQQISRLGTVTGSLTFKEIDLRQPLTKAKTRYGIRALALESHVETFNRWPFPETGKKHFLEVQVAGEFLGGDAEFTRFYSSLESYFPLGKYLNYHPRLAIGLSRSGLPPTEQFYIGGMHSFAGFRTHQLSGDKTFLLNQEVRLKLPLKLYFTVRYDIGEVYISTDQIKLRNLRHGFGTTIAVDLPVGPIEFGYGIADSDEDRFYFSAGLTF